MLSSEERLEIGREGLKKLHKKGAYGLNNWGISFEDEEEEYLWPGGACFGGMGRRVSLAKSAPTAFYDACLHNKHGKLNEGQKKYLDWFINKSQWAKAILTKDVGEAIKLGTVFDVNYSAQFLVGAGIFIRYIREFPAVIDNWQILKDVVDWDVALILSNVFIVSREGNILRRSLTYGHDVINAGNINYKIVEGFVNKKSQPVNPLKPFTETSAYYGLHTPYFTVTPEEIQRGIPRIIKGIGSKMRGRLFHQAYKKINKNRDQNFPLNKLPKYLEQYK